MNGNLIMLYGLIFVLWIMGIIIGYYSNFYPGAIDHDTVGYILGGSEYTGYILTSLFLYLLYKAYTVFLSPKPYLRFGFFTISGLVFLQIFIISLFYANLPEGAQGPLMTKGAVSGITLFFHILELSLYPILIVFISRGIGYSVIAMIVHNWRDIDFRIRLSVEISIGMMLFTVFLMFLGTIGMYTISGLIGVLIIMIILGIPGLRETYSDIRERYISLENHDTEGSIWKALNLHLISIEFAFFFLSFFLAVSLINVIRPMPIGWDDLGVYMNFPKLIALSGELIQGAGMYSWQLITSTGFLFGNNASQAFYINQLGGILAVIVIASSLSYIFQEKNKKTFLSLAMIFATVYYIMPMTVFQQAKDMKLDPAYLFFSLSGLFLIFSLWKNSGHNKKEDFLILFLAGIIIGFSFSVKFTSLMLILGVLGIIAYRILSIWGYIGFFFLFLAIFTYADFWKIMNVPMPRENWDLMRNISIILFSTGVIAIGGSVFGSGIDGKKKMYDWILSSFVFIIAVGIGCSPWLIKNASELGVEGIRNNPISILGGSGGVFGYDYSKIYSEEEIKKRKEMGPVGITNDGKSDNEDMGRYFGYESGLNNYLKLPPNLTFQRNQGGEFTDITYIFFALFPVALLFVRSRRHIYSFLILALLVFCILYYFIPITSKILTDIFSQWSLSMDGGIFTYGYGLILLLNIGFLLATHYLLLPSETNKKIQEMMMFMGIYAFIFMISAFGIVWYGIIVYYGFFVLIGLSLSTFLSYNEQDREDNSIVGISFYLASIVFILISIYFLNSALRHGWANLKSAYYNEYKYRILSQEESLFAYRRDYLLPIAHLNLKDISKIFDGIGDKLISPELKKVFSEGIGKDIDLEKWNSFVLMNRNSPNPKIRADARTIGKALYEGILYPKGENANLGPIYRIGTFMTYLIHENRKRYFDDSLIFEFERFFYDKDPEVTVDRMRKMGMKYLLMDLNAATIDRDPRRALTTRFEHLLLTTNAPSLKLINTDNFCLELAISERKKGKIQTDEEFLMLAGTNYESYKGKDVIYRGQKLAKCQEYIIKMINEGRNTEYPIVENIKNEILGEKAVRDPQKIGQILAKYINQSWFALFEILDTPASTPLSSSGNLVSTGSISSGNLVQTGEKKK